MKLKNILILIFSLVVVSLLSNCNGKDDPKPSNLDKVAKSWKVKKASVQSGAALYEEGGSSNVENYSAYRITFGKDGNFTRTEANSNQTTGKWAFASNETVITFDKGLPGEVTVVELKSDTMTISYSESTKTGTRIIVLVLIPA
jgi:hypothetical protein